MQNVIRQDNGMSFAGCDAVLADGATVHIRPIRPEDDEGLLAFHASLSPESIYFRFFSSHSRLKPQELERFTHVDGDNRMALVAILGEAIVGVARYDRSPTAPAEAEVAFVVTDSHQRRGLCTLLLEHLAAYARAHGIDEFVAETLFENRAMQNVFRQAGFITRSRLDRGVVDVRMDIRRTGSLEQAIDMRDRHASVESMRRLLEPRSIAVIGAARERGTIGHEILRSLLAGEFTGPVYPVHPTAESVAGVKTYSTVLDIPGDVDLGVVAVPADRVAAVIEQCAAKGVHAVVVISAGFAEAGSDGCSQQKSLVALARGAGMRLVGPNCMGVINTSGRVAMNATFAPSPPVPGRVAFASQSGGLGIAVLEEARRRGMGLSTFVSLGNKADVSSNDLLQYWENDDDTDVILLYLESFGNPLRFSRIARRVSRAKPIVAVKAGRTQSGSRAASSHTAALASADTAVDALFAQTGVIRVDTLQELFDVAQLLSSQPIPAGKRVAIIGNAGGPGILAADACEAAGLDVPQLAPRTQSALRGFLPAASTVTNPVDMVASASSNEYEKAVRLVLADENIDAVLVTYTPTLVADAEDVGRAVIKASRDAAKTVTASLVGMPTTPLAEPGCIIPSFSFPESAARALARACHYGSWLARDPGHPVQLPDIEPGSAREIVGKALATSPEGAWLGACEVAQLLGSYGVRVIASEVTTTNPEEVIAAAGRLGYPVALKSASPDLVHKSDRGAVKVSLGSEKELREALSTMKASLGDEMGGALVQAMADVGVEVIVGVVHDPSFGPLLMFGSGGTAVELFADRAFRVLPLTDVDVTELVREVRGSRLLFGYRGSPPVDVGSLEDLLCRVGRLAEDIPELREMDLNPVIVTATGSLVVDAKVRIVPAEPSYDPLVRRLR